MFSIFNRVTLLLTRTIIIKHSAVYKKTISDIGESGEYGLVPSTELSEPLEIAQETEKEIRGSIFPC